MGRKPTGRVRLQDPVTHRFVWVEPSQIHGPADGEEDTGTEEPAQARPEVSAPTVPVSSSPPAPIAPAPAPAATVASIVTRHTPPPPARSSPAPAPRARDDFDIDELLADDEDEGKEADEAHATARPVHAERAPARARVDRDVPDFFAGEEPHVEDIER